MIDKAEKLCKEWHEIGRESFNRRYENLDYDSKNYVKRVVEKKKYICLDEGSSGAFILDKTDGTIYRLKSKYGVPNKKKIVGHIDTVTAADLHKYRWW